ncbi:MULTISPECIES: hypothetical protein [Falsihalocynthiibacter]|uniref:hypothetical protein n=1 Tax=Falsihalocynthiibacter TaxID=2854182 RepID=UPI003003858E
MTNLFKAFAKSESGAVTVDWVVLTAGIVGLSIGVIYSLASSSSNVASNISEQVAEIEVISE